MHGCPSWSWIKGLEPPFLCYSQNTKAGVCLLPWGPSRLPWGPCHKPCLSTHWPHTIIVMVVVIHIMPCHPYHPCLFVYDASCVPLIQTPWHVSIGCIPIHDNPRQCRLFGAAPHLQFVSPSDATHTILLAVACAIPRMSQCRLPRLTRSCVVPLCQ